MEPQSMWSFVTSFFYLAYVFRVHPFLTCIILYCFLLSNNIPLYGYTTVYLSIHQLMGTCFHYLPIVNNAAVNICVPVFVWTYIFISFGLITRSGIAWLQSKSMFNIFRNYFPEWLYHFNSLSNGSSNCSVLFLNPHPKICLLI